MNKPERTGLAYHGRCPHCGHLHTVKGIQRDSGRESSGTLTQALASGVSVICNACNRVIEPTGKRTYWKPGKGKLRDYYKREPQLMVKETGWVDYGVLKRLTEQQGVKFGSMWEGSFDQLSEILQMRPEAVASQWNVHKDLGRKPTVDELRELGMFTVSL